MKTQQTRYLGKVREIIARNYIIKKPVFDVLQRLQLDLMNGKLRDIKTGTENIVVTCPCHGGGFESHPACNIYIGHDSKIPYGFFNCFVCGANGTFLRFISQCFESSEDFALHWLITTFEHEVQENKYFLAEDIDLTKRKKKPKKKLDESILTNYQSWTPYLAQRKLSRATCERFKVKYDPVYRQVIFPAYDIFGNLIMLSKRSIDTKSFYLDREVEKPVYCLNNIIETGSKVAIITEGPFDCLTGWEYGYPTCATFGRLSDYQIAQLNMSGITTLYTAFDNDEAGKAFTKVLKTKLAKHIIVHDVQLPFGKKDLNELTKEEFDACMKKASNS